MKKVRPSFSRAAGGGRRRGEPVIYEWVLEAKADGVSCADAEGQDGRRRSPRGRSKVAVDAGRFGAQRNSLQVCWPGRATGVKGRMLKGFDGKHESERGPGSRRWVFQVQIDLRAASRREEQKCEETGSTQNYRIMQPNTGVARGSASMKGATPNQTVSPLNAHS